MQISIAAEIRSVERYLTDVQKRHIPFAASRTINDLAKKIARKVMPEKAEATFKGGVPSFTKRGFFYENSTRRNLTAKVFIGEKQAEYLKFQILGGTRFPDRQSLMISTDKTKLNKFGNITRATYNNLINDKVKYFKGVPKGKAGKNYEGIWERDGRSARHPSGRRIRMVARYIDQAQYQPIFPYAKIAKRVVFSQDDGAASIFRNRLKQALASKRRGS